METDKKLKVLDIVKEIIFFVLFSLLAFAWLFLVQLIVSFVAVSVFILTIKNIFIFSAIGTVIADLYYVIKRVNRH